jgi:mono/diheme cytochrome c family protein
MKAPWVGMASSLVFFAVISGTALAEENAALAAKAKEILKTNCYRCHGQDGQVEGGLNYILDRQQLVARNKVAPADPMKSRLFKKVSSGEMPPEDEKPRPSAADIAVLKQWIEAGAPDFNPAAAKRQFVSPHEMLQAMRADLGKLPERDRRFVRYLTITHLYNAGLSEDQLQTYRHGLSKLVNSLSWGREVTIPVAVDTAKTVFRIDIRDYKWTEKVWDAIVSANPYGIIHYYPEVTYCQAATKTKVFHVRGDWFVYAASRPPLYHDVLQLPTTDRELESHLQVNVDNDIRNERVARAGFNGSGVSRNNRLVERHESGYGAYWKSYDFGGNAGPKNLFAYPLGPGEKKGSFQHDGGEILFSLPNGLQGYLLVDGKGNRIDKGPTAIVSDPKQGDRAVVNGISCMSCHAQGTIEKEDQVRSHVEKNKNAFGAKEAATILALYPPKDKFLGLVREDGKRFKQAVEKTGCQLGTTEPIVALASTFESEVDLALAAAEAGLKIEEFKDSLRTSKELSRTLGPLLVKGGTVQRQVFVASFGAICSELKLGQYVPPTATLAGHVTLIADFEKFGLTPRVQGNRDTCSLFAITALAEFECARSSKAPHPKLSEEFLIWAARAATGHKQEQAMFYEAVHGLNTYGICTAEQMPYAQTIDVNRKPSAAALADGKERSGRWQANWIKRWDVKRPMTAVDIEAIKKAIDNGHPVACGLRWPKDLGGSDLLAVPTPDKVVDGHSIVLVGYGKENGGSVFRFRNSRGPGWGDQGYGRISYAYVRAYANDALWLHFGPAHSEIPLERFHAETLKILAKEHCDCKPQDMEKWGGLMWTQRKQLFCQAEKDGFVGLQFTVQKGGLYRLRVLATAGPDYGVVRAMLDGKQLEPEFDLYCGRVSPAGSLELGTHELAAGQHRLRFTAVDKNRTSTGYYFGLDAIDLCSAK